MGRLTAAGLVVLFGLAGCGEAEVEEVPETAEIEGFDADAPVGERLELDEETVLGPDDIGENLMATGWVAGLPLPNGFFLRTEDDRVIFVDAEQSVEPGQTVRVIGQLTATDAVVFEGWETDAFDAGFEAEWDVETVVYLDASSVMPVNGEAGAGAAGQEGAVPATPQGATQDTAEAAGADHEPGSDPGSKSG